MLHVTVMSSHSLGTIGCGRYSDFGTTKEFQYSLRSHGVFPTELGTPQGGIISPCLANMTLDGLEAAIQTGSVYGCKVNCVRYAHDFIVTGDSREVLVQRVLPALERFLAARGLQLSAEKTRLQPIGNCY